MNLAEGQTIELKQEIVNHIRKTVIAFTESEDRRIYIGALDKGET